MGKCVYYGHQGRNSKTATLHTFPSDEAVCKEWVKLIGREGWKPAKSSFLCSKHFTEDSFIFHYSNRKRLKPGCVPTILNNGPRFPEQRKVLAERNCADKKRFSCSQKLMKINIRYKSLMVKIKMHIRFMRKSGKWNQV